MTRQVDLCHFGEEIEGASKVPCFGNQILLTNVQVFCVGNSYLDLLMVNYIWNSSEITLHFNLQERAKSTLEINDQRKLMVEMCRDGYTEMTCLGHNISVVQKCTKMLKVCSGEE